MQFELDAEPSVPWLLFPVPCITRTTGKDCATGSVLMSLR